MEISGIGNQLNKLYQDASKDKTTEETFKQLLDEAGAIKDDQKLKEACEEFEAYYVQRLFKEMRKSLPKGGLFEESNERGIYEDMLDEKMAANIADGKGIGIADSMYQQLSKLKK